MLKRNPPPDKILIGDTIVIAAEDERYQDLVHSKFQVLEIDLNRPDGRVIKPGQFNGNPVRHISAPKEDYWTKAEFMQVDKRTVNGQDIYYETSLAKTIENFGKHDFPDLLFD